MYQAWLFAASIAAGTGLFAYAAQQRGTAPPDLAPAPEAVRVVPQAAPAPIVEPPEPSVLEIEPIVIEARQRPVPMAAPAPKPKVVDRPCSDWRELGPSRVSDNKAVGSVSVRALCP